MLPATAPPDYEAAGVREDNLLVKIWLHPRATLHFILTRCPTRYVTALLVLGGIVRALDRAESQHLGDRLSGEAVLTYAVVLGGLMGWTTYYFYSWGLELAGRWLGGRTGAATFRTLIAWAMVPTSLTLLTTLLGYALVGDALFQSTDYDPATGVGLAMTALSCLEVGLSVWSIVVFVKGLMLTQQFNVGRAMLNMILPGAMLLGIIFGFLALFTLFEAATS